MEAIDILAERGEIEALGNEDSEASRGSNDPPPHPHAPNRTPFRQKYTLLTRIVWIAGNPFRITFFSRNMRLLRGVPWGESANRKNKCEICGAFFSKARKLRRFQSFHAEVAIASAPTKFGRLESIDAYPPPLETWGDAFDCSRCEASIQNIALLHMHSGNCTGLTTIGNSRLRCELCRAIIHRNKWEPHLCLSHSKGRLDKTEIESAEFAQKCATCYACGGMSPHLHSLRRHELKCNKGETNPGEVRTEGGISGGQNH